MNRDVRISSMYLQNDNRLYITYDPCSYTYNKEAFLLVATLDGEVEG